MKIYQIMIRSGDITSEDIFYFQTLFKYELDVGVGE